MVNGVRRARLDKAIHAAQVSASASSLPLALTLSPGDRTNITLYFDTSGSEEPLTLVAEAEVRSIGE